MVACASLLDDVNTKQGHPFLDIRCSTPKFVRTNTLPTSFKTLHKKHSPHAHRLCFFPQLRPSKRLRLAFASPTGRGNTPKEKMTATAQCLRLQTASQCGEKPFQVQTAHSHTATCTSFFESNFQIEQLFEAAFIELPQCLLDTL